MYEVMNLILCYSYFANWRVCAIAVWQRSIRCVQTWSFFTHIFLQLLDAGFVWFGVGITAQTRSAVVTHGLEKKTDGYLTLFDSFVLFFSNTWPVQIVWSWLGGVPVTHGDRRHGPGYIPQPSAVRDTSSPTSGVETSGTKTTLKMSPNMACEALQSFSPRLTVAKRKEAIELRKVSEATEFCLIILHFSVFHLM